VGVEYEESEREGLRRQSLLLFSSAFESCMRGSEETLDEMRSCGEYDSTRVGRDDGLVGNP
jgi:hypothetical protein